MCHRDTRILKECQLNIVVQAAPPETSVVWINHPRIFKLKTLVVVVNGMFWLKGNRRIHIPFHKQLPIIGIVTS